MVTRLLIRLVDFWASFFGLLLLWPVILVISLLLLRESGVPFFIQERVGRYKKPFWLVKFRTMWVGTRSVATHEASRDAVTPLGRILRRTKLDELPQLWNVLKGEMSLVGPRPNLFNQEELIKERSARGVYNVLPGITGLAQIQNIDMSTPRLLAETDAKMLSRLSLRSYFNYIFWTVFGKGQGDAMKEE